MLMSAPIESTYAAMLVLFGITYSASGLLNHLTRKARAQAANA